MTDSNEHDPKSVAGVLMEGFLHIGADDEEYNVTTRADILMRYQIDNPLTVDIIARAHTIPVMQGFSLERDLIKEAITSELPVGDDTTTVLWHNNVVFFIERSMNGNYIKIQLPVQGVSHMMKVMEEMVADPSTAFGDQMEAWLKAL